MPSPAQQRERAGGPLQGAQGGAAGRGAASPAVDEVWHGVVLAEGGRIQVHADFHVVPGHDPHSRFILILKDLPLQGGAQEQHEVVCKTERRWHLLSSGPSCSSHHPSTLRPKARGKRHPGPQGQAKDICSDGRATGLPRGVWISPARRAVKVLGRECPPRPDPGGSAWVAAFPGSRWSCCPASLLICGGCGHSVLLALPSLFALVTCGHSQPGSRGQVGRQRACGQRGA